MQEAVPYFQDAKLQNRRSDLSELDSTVIDSAFPFSSAFAVRLQT